MKPKKSSDKEENDLIEGELKTREDEMGVQVKSKSTLGRLQGLFSAYSKRHQQSEEEKKTLQETVQKLSKDAEDKDVEQQRLKTEHMNETSTLADDIRQLRVKLDEEKQFHETTAQKVAEQEEKYREQHKHNVKIIEQKCEELKEKEQQAQLEEAAKEKLVQKLQESHKEKRNRDKKVTELQQKCMEQEQQIIELVSISESLPTLYV